MCVCVLCAATLNILPRRPSCHTRRARAPTMRNNSINYYGPSVESRTRHTNAFTFECVCVCMPPVATATTAFSRAPNCHTQRLHTAASVHPPTYCLRLCDVLMLGCRHASSANMLCERALVCRRVLPIAGLDFCNRESERARPPNNVYMCACACA